MSIVFGLIIHERAETATKNGNERRNSIGQRTGKVSLVSLALPRLMWLIVGFEDSHVGKPLFTPKPSSDHRPETKPRYDWTRSGALLRPPSLAFHSLWFTFRTGEGLRKGRPL